MKRATSLASRHSALLVRTFSFTEFTPRVLPRTPPRPPRSKFSWITLKVFQRSGRSSSRRCGVNSCAGRMGRSASSQRRSIAASAKARRIGCESCALDQSSAVPIRSGSDFITLSAPSTTASRMWPVCCTFTVLNIVSATTRPFVHTHSIMPAWSW